MLTITGGWDAFSQYIKRFDAGRSATLLYVTNAQGSSVTDIYWGDTHWKFRAADQVPILYITSFAGNAIKVDNVTS